MHHTSGYIKVGKEQLHYLKAGSGKKLLLGFPGYGHDGSSLLFFEPFLKQEYTCIFIDLPHHGLSQWSPGVTFTRQNLKSMCLELMREYNVNEINLLGYSMGGRVCQTIIEELPLSVSKMTLIAPDGLAPNKYYFFFTRVPLGSWLFQSMLARPEPYIKVLSWLKNNKWISEWQHKFVSHYISTEAIRKQLSLVWPTMSKLMPSRKKVRNIIENKQIPVHLFMGKYDKVIPAALGKKFAKDAKSVQLHILDKGHHIIGADTASLIAQTLL